MLTNYLRVRHVCTALLLMDQSIYFLQTVSTRFRVNGSRIQTWSLDVYMQQTFSPPSAWIRLLLLQVAECTLCADPRGRFLGSASVAF